MKRTNLFFCEKPEFLGEFYMSCINYQAYEVCSC